MSRGFVPSAAFYEVGYPKDLHVSRGQGKFSENIQFFSIATKVESNAWKMKIFLESC